MEHLKEITPGLHKALWSRSPRFVTIADYMLDPFLSPIHMKSRGYKRLWTSKKYVGEFEAVLGKTAPYKRIPLGRLHTILDGTLTAEAGLYLYTLIREKRPRTVVETGISYGFSTAIILCALNANRYGYLYSTDIRHEVGSMLWGTDLLRWHKCIGNPNNVLKQTLKKAGKIDIFMHDSDHSYENMKYEFDQAYTRMARGGYILSDDIDDNMAFSDFCKNKGITPMAVYSSSKLFGVMKLGSNYGKDRL